MQLKYGGRCDPSSSLRLFITWKQSGGDTPQRKGARRRRVLNLRQPDNLGRGSVVISETVAGSPISAPEPAEIAKENLQPIEISSTRRDGILCQLKRRRK